ncbi:MAG: hypothetical protein ACOZNI_00080 [Myxococcota bacterium]
MNHWLYTFLADDPAGPTRQVCYRGDFHEEVLPPNVAGLPCGTGVMLQGRPGKWTAAYKEQVQRWNLPPIEAIRAGTTGEDRISLAGVAPGMFTVDDAGIACEIGRLGDLVVLNYAGWKLNHFAAAFRVPVTRAGRFVIVEPDVDLAALLRARVERVPYEADAVVWGDRVVTFPDGAVACPRATALLEPVKDLLAAHLGEPIVRVVGDGEPYVELPDGFAGFLDELPRLRLVRAARRSRERGLRPMPEVLGDAGIDDAFDAEELGLAARGAALRELMSLRTPGEPAWMWAGHAVLVPVGAGIWAWEVVEEGHATYLFRPDRVERLAAVLSDPGIAREALREDPSLGYLDRVWHGEDARWGSDLRRTLVSLGADTRVP